MAKMRIIIITGEYPHHKNLCSELFRRYEVAAIYHPRFKRPTLRRNLEKTAKEIRECGWIHAIARLAAKLPQPFRGWDVKWSSAEFQKAEQEFFPRAEEAYRQIPGKLIHPVVNVNSPETVNQIAQTKADVIVCLGGPVYRKGIIQAAPLALNFHTGLSPLYNGADTISFPFAHGHIRLCGGTLMLMNERVDGGDILASYLPEIRADDNPATISMRIFAEIPRLYTDFLEFISTGRSFSKCAQPPPLFYCRGRDWTIIHAQAARRHVRAGLQRYVRPARRVIYWDRTEQEARVLLQETMLELMEIQ